MKILNTLLAAAALLLATPGLADTYRWVDADGTVHYGDVPQGATPEVVPQAPPAAAAPNQEALNAELRKSIESRSEEQARAAAEAKQRAERAHACSQARQGLQYMETVTAHRLRVTQEQYDARRLELEAAARQSCT